MSHFRVFSICSSLDPESGFFIYREDRRRGYIGNDYGEDDDEVDYSKMYQEEEDVNLFVSKIHFLTKLYLNVFSCSQDVQAMIKGSEP